MRITTQRLTQIRKEDETFPNRYTRTTFRADEFGVWYENYLAGSKLDYTVERARLTKAQADEKELQVKILSGDLITREVHIETLSTLVANSRAKLLTIPTKLAQTAIAATNLSEIETEAMELIYEALLELANGQYTVSESDDPESMEPASTLNG